MPPRAPAACIPWRSLGVLALALGVTALVALWIHAMGGPSAFRTRYGLLAPLLSYPAHVATTLTPIGEVIPFGMTNGAVYGIWMGAALNWAAWMTAAALQYAFGRGARREVGGAEALPRWFRPLPLTHPLVLATARWLPGGGPLIDAAAGARGVAPGRLLLCAGLGHAPQAVAIAAVGAGLVRLL